MWTLLGSDFPCRNLIRNFFVRSKTCWELERFLTAISYRSYCSYSHFLRFLQPFLTVLTAISYNSYSHFLIVLTEISYRSYRNFLTEIFLQKFLTVLTAISYRSYLSFLHVCNLLDKSYPDSVTSYYVTLRLPMLLSIRVFFI